VRGLAAERERGVAMVRLVYRAAAYILRSCIRLRSVFHTSSSQATGWLKGRVKEVVSGDTVVLVAANAGAAVPAEKRLTLSSLLSPRLVRLRTARAPRKLPRQPRVIRCCQLQSVGDSGPRTAPPAGQA
jgi:hypothetical protein